MTKEANKELLSITETALDLGGALDIKVFQLDKQGALADFMLVASGTSSRHVAGIAHRVSEAMKKEAQINASIEGLPDANWVLVDGGDVVVHIFRPEVREYYAIETLWESRPAPSPAPAAPR